MLHMMYTQKKMRDPENYFPPKVKTLFMSQSDFFLEEAQEFGREHVNTEKIYDFVYHAGVSNCGEKLHHTFKHDLMSVS